MLLHEGHVTVSGTLDGSARGVTYRVEVGTARVSFSGVPLLFEFGGERADLSGASGTLNLSEIRLMQEDVPVAVELGGGLRVDSLR